MDDFGKYYQCDSCEASFKVSHSLEENKYSVACCPFCGETEFFEDDVEDD
jgi:predicted nucleic-acid-binding Zn-ribbon protein